VGNIRFAWDPKKALTNVLKHQVAFEEAQPVFFDDHARLIDDPDHSGDEQRFPPLWHSFQARCPMVSHYYRQDDAAIRLISARRATPREEYIYWSFL